MERIFHPDIDEQVVHVTITPVVLEGTLSIPATATGIVLFAHGSGSSRHSPRNRYVAQMLRTGGLATLLLDLLTPDEAALDERTRHLRFDIGLLTRRLVGATDWLGHFADTNILHVGYFGASTGAAAALMAATERPQVVRAVVGRGGRPDLAQLALPHVQAPTLLIVGGNDTHVFALNQEALRQMQTRQQLVIVPGATHLFEEPGALEEVARLARDWFCQHLGPPATGAAAGC